MIFNSRMARGDYYISKEPFWHKPGKKGKVVPELS
jgi:hypothetical protein